MSNPNSTTEALQTGSESPTSLSPQEIQDVISPIIYEVYGGRPSKMTGRTGSWSTSCIEILRGKIQLHEPGYRDSRERMIMLTLWDWFSGGTTAENTAGKIEAALREAEAERESRRCLTPGAVYHFQQTGYGAGNGRSPYIKISMGVTLPDSFSYLMNKEAATQLEADLHDAFEAILAPYFKES